jgi:hypothetical protein
MDQGKTRGTAHPPCAAAPCRDRRALAQRIARAYAVRSRRVAGVVIAQRASDAPLARPGQHIQHRARIMTIRYVTVALLTLLAACNAGGRDTRVDVDARDSITGTGLQSQDLKTMVSQMCAKLKADGILAPGREGERASFFITPMRNEGSDSINKELIVRNLRTALFDSFGRQIRIIDRSAEAAELVTNERLMKERGEVSGTNDRPVAGSNFVLKGVIASLDRQGGRLKMSYINVTFELTDLVTQELVWTGAYEMKTESEYSVINR